MKSDLCWFCQWNTVKLGYNKHGYNELLVIANNYFPFLQSQTHDNYINQPGYVTNSSYNEQIWPVPRCFLNQVWVYNIFLKGRTTAPRLVLPTQKAARCLSSRSCPTPCRPSDTPWRWPMNLSAKLSTVFAEHIFSATIIIESKESYQSKNE